MPCREKIILTRTFTFKKYSYETDACLLAFNLSFIRRYFWVTAATSLCLWCSSSLASCNLIDDTGIFSTTETKEAVGEGLAI